MSQQKNHKACLVELNISQAEIEALNFYYNVEMKNTRIGVDDVDITHIVKSVFEQVIGQTLK